MFMTDPTYLKAHRAGSVCRPRIVSVQVPPRASPRLQQAQFRIMRRRAARKGRVTRQDIEPFIILNCSTSSRRLFN
jgi:hypothetical protein